ncbi:putative cytochrome P450 110 [Hyella patelloides LEGE 07179]|uniref:Putative cytochrome P450 110 n=1 Tax=Hyella patelloides LEGE 07179 TaxID=945734 RepID=A0A563W265_9CYAN|nr:cytochrome P450 [Hyella patelloides]VEP17633.1 putative cytochrome P450 110 [Hyella patelloides LEGE 07179]
MKPFKSPQSLPLVQLINWIFRPLDFLEECASKYGDMFNLRLMGLPPFTVVSNPQGIEEILSVDAQKFDVGRTNNLAGSLLGDNSLVLLDGVTHRRQRKLMMPPFHGEKVKSYAQTICQITQQVAHRWQEKQTFVAQKAMQDITFETILHVVFGLSEGERYQQIKPSLIELLDLTGSPLKASVIFLPFLQQDLGEWSPWGKVVRRKCKIYELMQAEIDERRASPELSGNDVLTLMMSARDEAGEGLSDIELKDQMMTLLVAGHETTATALSWAFYWIHKIPEVKQKLLAELDGFADLDDPLAIARLPYLTAVCNETLRINPVVITAFMRLAKSPIEVMGYQFAPGTILTPTTYLTHYREDIYPEPKKFRPERFLERQYSPYEFLPFGGGNRRCIGYALALLEMKLVLATVLTRYDLTLASDRPVVPTRRGATIAPNNGVPLILQGKRDRKIQEQLSTIQ